MLLECLILWAVSTQGKRKKKFYRKPATYHNKQHRQIDGYTNKSKDAQDWNKEYRALIREKHFK